MSHKTWSFTTYRDGKPVATETDLNHDQALTAIRAAISGEPVLSAVKAEARVEVAQPQRQRELAHAA